MKKISCNQLKALTEEQLDFVSGGENGGGKSNSLTRGNSRNNRTSSYSKGVHDVANIFNMGISGDTGCGAGARAAQNSHDRNHTRNSHTHQSSGHRHGDRWA